MSTTIALDHRSRRGDSAASVDGNETTRHLLSGGMRALLEFPGERRRLVTDRFDGTLAHGSQDPGHLAFGIGPHSCLGATLALLEAAVLFDELLDRFPDGELAGAVEPLRSTVMNGIVSMPVVLPAPSG